MAKVWQTVSDLHLRGVAYPLDRTPSRLAWLSHRKQPTGVEMHWAYVEWTPDFEGEHEVTVTAEHKHKACAAKSDDTDVIVECDVTLPDVLRHVVWADSKDAAMAAARCFALNSLPWGASYGVVYIGATSA